MKTNKKTAFPFYESNDHAGQIILADDGMSLLDYFAGKALNGICACSLDNYGAISNNAEPDYIANKCYDIAKAMIKRRSLEIES